MRLSDVTIKNKEALRFHINDLKQYGLYKSKHISDRKRDDILKSCINQLDPTYELETIKRSLLKTKKT